MSKEQKLLENKVDCNLVQGISKKSDGTRNTSHGGTPGAEVFSESSSDKEERDHRSTNKTDKKKVVQVSPRNSPPELIHYLKDRHGPKRTDDNSPPQLLPEVIVTRTKLNKEKLPVADLLPFNKKGKWDVNNFPDMPPEVKQETIKSSPKSKKKCGQKSSSADECLNNEPLKNSVQISFGEASDRNESVVEIQRRLILDLQEKQKKLRQSEKFKKTYDRIDRIFQLPKLSVPAETTSILPSESDVSNEDRRRAVTCKSSSTDGDSVASKNEKIFNHHVEESLESLIHEPEYSSDIQDESSLVDFEDWITEEEVEDVDDELFTTPQHVSTGKEERDLIDGIEFLSFETEHDMVEFTKIELDFNGVIPHDDLVVQSDDGLDMVDDSFVYSEPETLSATQAIVPTKTKDITKIKGWRTKQFAVNDNPMLGHCSSTYGICEDDDGFGSCDVKLGEELSLDVNEDHRWDGEEQEAPNIINVREKVSAEREDKTVNEEVICNSAFGMSSENKSNPLKDDVIPNTISPAQLKGNKHPKEIIKDEKDEKSYVENSPEDEKRTRLTKPSKSYHSRVDSQTRLSVQALQKHGRKPKTLAEKRMLMELEQKRKDRRKQRKRLKRRPRRPKRSNKESPYKSHNSAIEEESRPRIYEFRKRLKTSFTADNDSEEFSDKDECLEEAVLDETRNKEIASLNAVKSQRSKYVLDKNYCYYWYQGKPIRLAGSHKNQETEEENLLGSEDHSVDASLYDAAIPGLDVGIHDTMPKKPDLEMPTKVSTCNGTGVEDNNSSDSFEYSLIVNPTVGSPLVPLAVSQLDLLRSNSQYIDENWAKFSASVVVSRDWRKNPLPRNRIVLPMRISNLRKAAMLDVPRPKSSITKLPPSFQCAPTGLRLVRPLQPLGSDANILSPRFGPLGSSSVRMRYPKPPTLKGIRTIPGSVRLNPIVSGTKTLTSPSPSPPPPPPPSPVNNKPPEKQKSKKEPQLLGKRGKAKISNWKAKLNNLTCSVSMPINVSEIDNDVQNVVEGMVNYVVLRELCDTFIDDDPDVNEPDPLEHQVSPQRGKYKKKKALFRELSKLDVTVIDMDMHENSGETKEDSSKETCNQEYCKLGCVCGSLQVCKSLFPQHCGLVQCMFGCKCDMPANSAHDKDKSHVLSEEAILSLQNKNSRFLAKEEKEFRHTVIRAKDEMIIVGGDGTVRRKREIKLPGRYRDSYMTLGVGLNELKLPVEDVDQPRRSGRSLNTVEYITPSVGKKLVEKKLSTIKEPCNVLECQVKIEKLDLPEDRVNPLCMDHSTYTCNCFKNSEICLKGDGPCGETNSQKLGTLSLHEINNSVIMKPKPGIMQGSFSPLQHKGEDITIVKTEVEPCALSTEMVNEARSLLKSKHKLDVLASPMKHTEVQPFNTTTSKVPVLENESSVSAPVKQRSKLSTKPSVESSKTESKKSAFLKLAPKPSFSSIQETLNDLPLLKSSKTKSRNVAVKSTTRPPALYTHPHDIFQHSARTALPSIDYRMKNLTRLRIRQQNGNVCLRETSLSAFNNSASELCNSLTKSDTINLVPCTEIKEEAVSGPEFIPEDSSEIIGKIESVTSLSVEEFHRVESGVEREEENICSEKKSMASPKQFKVKSNVLQCAGSITTNENVRNLTAEELEILLQKAESSRQINPKDNKMDSEKSVHLLHFPLVKNLFNSGHIQLWFSKRGNGSKLIMTTSKEKPEEAYVNLKDISMSNPLELPELISDILKKPDPSSVSCSGDKNDQCNTYVLLRFDGKSIEVGKTMGGNISHVEFSQDLITDNAERQNIDGLLASQTFLNKERLDFGGEISKSGERISNGSSELSDFMEPLSATISGSKLSEPIDKQNNDTICKKLSRVPGCSKESNNSTCRKLYLTDGSFSKTTALHTKKQDLVSDTSIRGTSPKEEVTKISADGYVRSLDIPPVELNDGQDLSKLEHGSEHIPVTLENDKRNLTFSKENCKESLSKLKQLQFLTRFKNAVITSKIRKIPEKQLKTSDVEGNEVKSLPVPVSDESDSSDTTVKIPLPTCKGCRWYVLSTDKKFDIMFSTSRQCSVKFEQILEAISISERQKGTVCLPFTKSQGDIVAAGNKRPKFGIYAVSGISTKVFIGPYSHNEDSCLAFYKRSADGGYVDACHVEELGKDCSGMEKSKQGKKEYFVDKQKQVSCEESTIVVKDVWLYSPEEMADEKTVENCLRKSKIVEEECLSSGMNKQGNVADSANVAALETPADNTRESNEINSFIGTPSESKEVEKLQTVRKRTRLTEGNLVLDLLTPGKSHCKGPDNQSVIHVGSEIPSCDAEDLDIETVSEDTSALTLERMGVPLTKQNFIILPSGTKCAIQKTRFRPIQPAPPVTVKQDSKDSALPVKLIPSVKNIGYISAMYYADGKIIFRHPIERVKVSFSSMGAANQWLHRFLQSRIRYIPKQLKVMWKPVGQAHDCQGMEPFKTNVLNGNYILTMRGLFNLKEISASEAINYGLRYGDVIRLQEKRNRRDLQEGFNKLRKLLFEGSHTSKIDLLLKARENILCLRTTGKMLEKKKKSLQLTKNSIFQRLGTVMKEMTSVDKRDTLMKIKKLLEELRTRTPVPVVELDGDSDSEGGSVNNAEQPIIDLSGSESDLEDYLSDGSCHSEGVKNYSAPTEGMSFAEKKRNDAESMKLSHNKNDDSSISISVVKDVHDSSNQKEDLAHNDEVTVTCIPLTNSAEVTVKPEIDHSFGDISISRERLFPFDTSKEKVVLDKRDIGRTNDQKNLPSSDVEMEEPGISSMKRKRSKSVDDDVVIFGSSSKKSCSNENVSGITISTPTPLQEPIIGRSHRNITVWPCSDSEVGSDSDLVSAVPVVKKEPLNIGVVKLGSSLKKSPNSYPCGINIFNNKAANRMSNFKIISGKIEGGNRIVGGDTNKGVHASKVSSETVNKPGQSPLFMRLVKSPNQTSTDMDRGLNFLKVGSQSVKTPVKVTIHSKLQSDDSKQPSSNIGTHSKTSLKYVYSSSGGKMYVNGPSGPLPLVVATRAPSSSQDESKRTMTLTVSKPKFGSSPNVLIPNSPVKSVNSDNSASVDALKIPVKKPSVRVAQTQAQGGVISTNLPHLDVPVILEKKDISHSESLMKWVANNDSSDHIVPRITVAHGSKNDTVRVVADR